MRRFQQVDVFTAVPYLGNPVAVVLDCDRIPDAQMLAFANWTNLSETTFVLPPTDPGADYRLRIFTPARELPFAGHPTLGSCHAWLAEGGVPAGEHVVQQCGVGNVAIRRDGERLAFAAPPPRRMERMDESTLAHACAAAGIAATAVHAHQVLDNGPVFHALLVADAATVLGCRPDFAAIGDLNVALVGPYGDHGADDPAVEIRVFAPGSGVPEDPVTGSFNAIAAQWLIGRGTLPERYVASQGTVLGRRGRVHIGVEADQVWVGGEAVTCIRGTVAFSN